MRRIIGSARLAVEREAPRPFELSMLADPAALYNHKMSYSCHNLLLQYILYSITDCK